MKHSDFRDFRRNLTPSSKRTVAIGANKRYGGALFSESFIEQNDKKQSHGGNNKLEHVKTDYSFNTQSNLVTP